MDVTKARPRPQKKTLTINLNENDNLTQVIAKVTEKEGIPLEQQRLVFRDEEPNSQQMATNSPFLSGAFQLVQEITALQNEIQNLRKAVKDVEMSKTIMEKDLLDLKQFSQNTYAHLLTYHESISGEKFARGIESLVNADVNHKIMPEIWKLQDGISGLEKRLNEVESNPSPEQINPELAQEVKSLLTRVATLGEERIQHIEVIGDNKYSDGTLRRKIVTEKELENHRLGVRQEWAAQSDNQAINENFKQITKMFNDVLLVRIEEINTNLNNRISSLEKKIDVIHTLYNTMRAEELQRSKEQQLNQQKNGK